MTVVTRIAPSPTGDPHVGTAYIGLFNYVLAKQSGGRFLFRLEDTDRNRYDAASEQRLLDMLGWLDLQPDEGPDIGGEAGPYRQSERLELYQQHAQNLLAQGHAYRAFETQAELEQIQLEQKRLGRPLGYDGRGRSVSAAESDRRAVAGEPFVVRLRIPEQGTTTFEDALRGTIEIANSEIRDAVLLKSDGFPTYHLAVVIDDHLMGVTHILRAEEWIASTPIHALLYRAFGWQEPNFVHMPLLRNPDESKVSKRKLDTSVESYRQQGIVPEALLNYLGTLGWSMPNGKEFFDRDEMIANFDPTRISLGGPVFDLKRLRHYNEKYLREILSLKDVAGRVAPLLEAAGYRWADDDYLLDVVDVLRPRASTLLDFIDQSAYFFSDDFGYSDDARKRVAAGQKYLEDMERELSMLEFFDYDSVDDLIRDYVQEQSIGLGKVMMPLRAAITGVTNAPGVADLMVILGKQRVLRRIGRSLGDITSALLDDKPQKPEADKSDKGASSKAVV